MAINGNFGVATNTDSTQMAEDATELQKTSLADTASLVQTAGVEKINADAEGTNISSNTGQVSNNTSISGASETDANTVKATTSSDSIQETVGGMKATQGTIEADNLVDPATQDPETLRQLELDAAQLAAPQVVSPAAQRTLESGEMISGSAVDMAAVDAALQIEAATAMPSDQATVKGQLGELMQDFEGGAPPAWAAGAMRAATAAMAARGIGSSSMAGQAIIQATMESALPIAMADASTFAKFESQNLSNRQQTAMFAAEQRANFLGMEFTQEFQTRVANAAKISDIANMNFTAEQTVALENARLAQSVDLANLGAQNAKVLSDAAAMSNMDMTNLNNRQQAAVQNAQSFLQMDMANMELKQQTKMFKAQANIDAIFSDQSAKNAAKQFNAASQNQTDQFFANMETQVQQFNAGLKVDRQQFNATNALVVAQANAQWRQNAETVDTAAQNEANRQAAQATNGMTSQMVDTVWQRERDIMDYAFRQSESQTDRNLSVFLADKEVGVAKWESAERKSAANREGLGMLLGWALG
tara:strand:- start:186 stop:1784 length:1599 start_codon:yes stop_codon:yes gene_type:complete